MRKPRDYDAELKALDDKAKLLKRRKLEQLGELVIATGADVIPIEELAGALLAAAKSSDANTREAWRLDGAKFFRGAGRAASNTRANTRRGKTDTSGAQSTAEDARLV